MFYILPTPIGNIEDITIRTIRILKKTDFILAENRKNSKILLYHYNIYKPIYPYHKHNEHKIIPFLIKKLKENLVISLISNAGTPAISDPGFLLIKSCIENNIKVLCLPGATALIPALAISGFSIQEFVFLGFYFKKRIDKKLKELSEEKKTSILYESPHRIIDLFFYLEKFLGNRQIVVCREITKKFEEILRGTSIEILSFFKQNYPIGEIIIIIEGKIQDKNLRNK